MVLRSLSLARTGCGVECWFPSRFSPRFARISPRFRSDLTAAGGGRLANYTKLFFCIIRVWRFFTVLAKTWQGNFLYTGKTWQGKTAYGGSPPGTDGGRHWQNLVKSVYLINPQRVRTSTGSQNGNFTPIDLYTILQMYSFMLMP